MPQRCHGLDAPATLLHARFNRPYSLLKAKLFVVEAYMILWKPNGYRAGLVEND